MISYSHYYDEIFKKTIVRTEIIDKIPKIEILYSHYFHQIL